jgi:outer membrane protein TolC
MNRTPLRRHSFLPLAFAVVSSTPSAAFALQGLDEFVKGAKAAGLDEREARLTAEQRGREADVALGRLLPTLTASLTYTRNQYPASLDRPAATGGIETIVITPEDQLDGNLTLRVPLIDVGGWFRVSAARAGADAASLRASATAADAEAEVSRLYYTLVGATWLRDAAKKSQAAAESNLGTVEKRKAAERALETDVLRAKAEVERAKRAVAEAEQQVSSATRSLRTLTGVEPTAGVPAFDPPRADELPKPEAERLAATAPAVRAAEADARQAERTRDAAWAALAPTVTATLNERFTNATGFANQSAIFSLQLAATITLDYSAVAQARATDTAAAIAKVRAERARLAQVDQASDASDRVRVQAVRAKAARAEEESTEQAVKLWRERLAAGNATLLEVVQAERDALSASASRIQAEADLAYARALLKAKTGRAP